MKTTTILGQTFIVDDNLNLIIDDIKIEKNEMENISNEYKGVNRIHKPMALLFWTDVKNGKALNWTI